MKTQTYSITRFTRHMTTPPPPRSCRFVQRQLTLCRLRLAICYFPFPITWQLLALCYLRFAICYSAPHRTKPLKAPITPFRPFSTV